MLELRQVNVTFSTNGQMRAVRDVSLIVPDKRVTVMMGETGSGKSVLLLAILRLLPPTAIVGGSIALDGRDLLRLSEKDMAQVRGKRISYIPQGNGAAMNPLMRVGYQVGEPLMVHRGYSVRQAADATLALLRALDLQNEEQVASQYPHQLSGGMRQRAMIAMGMAADAAIILADEPTKGLDPGRIEQVVAAFLRLRGKTVLCVTHDVDFAEQVAEDVCILYAGELVECAPRSDFFEEPLHPYANALVMAQPKNGLHCTLTFTPHRIPDACAFWASCPRRMQRCGERPPLVEQGERKVRCWLYAD
ncbi:MAG TPA: ABC transporter ATP-binding protein [Clostridia bacterium]|nr:ABC transporter ATP-binding protein [Clostridia bacterium]